MSLQFLYRLAAIVCVLMLAVSSCSPQVLSTPQIVSATPVPATPIPTAEIRISTPAFTGVIFSEAVPQKLREYIGGAEIPSNISIQVDLSQSGVDGIRFRWVYALVAPFPTVKDGVTTEELRSLWTSGGTPLLMEESTLRAFTAIWGKPATGSVRSVEGNQLLDTAWDESAWAIIPFESLEPKWKVLTVDGQSPIRKGFDLARYPLVVDFTMQSDGIVDVSSWILSNYDPNKLTTIIMTGVTALVRATAVTMELKGPTYPGEKCVTFSAKPTSCM
jgi:hypothetical protein